MTSKKTGALAAGLLSLAAFPAHAETFDGPYVGAQAGWNRAEIAGDATAGQELEAPVAQDGLVVGGYAGYNKKIGERFVIGVEAGFSGTVDDAVTGISGEGSLTVDPRYSFDAGVRAGYLVDDRTLAYLRGGYANTRLRTILENDAQTVRHSDNIDGWQVGGGVERALTDRISARLEYRFSDLGERGAKYDQHQALVGISYNF